MSQSARRLLVGFDASPASAAALRHAIQLARRNHGLLVVLYVVPDHPPIVVNSPFGTCAAVHDDRCEAAADLLRKTRDQLPPTISVLTVVQPGRVGPSLAQVADRFGCDTIVIGARNGLWSRISGGVERYLRHTDARLLITREHIPDTRSRVSVGAARRACRSAHPA